MSKFIVGEPSYLNMHVLSTIDGSAQVFCNLELGTPCFHLSGVSVLEVIKKRLFYFSLELSESSIAFYLSCTWHESTTSGDRSNH